MKVIKIERETASKPKNTCLEVSYFKNTADSEIWDSFKQGDDTALAHIYQEHISPLFNFGCQFSPNKELIKDCIQDIFIDLKLKRQKLPEVRSVRAYLYKCLYNMLIRKLSKKGRFTQISEHESLDSTIDIPIDSYIIGNETATIKIKWLQKQLNTLNKRQKQAILLYYCEGFSYEEVADIMGAGSGDGARMLIKRGLDKMRMGARGNDQLFFSALTALMLIGSM